MSMFTDLSKLSRNYQKEINQLASLITKFKSTILAVNARHDNGRMPQKRPLTGNRFVNGYVTKPL